MNKIEAIFQAVRLNAWEDYISQINTVDINLTNEYGQNLLHEAIAHKSNRIAEHLIELCIDVNRQDDNGQTPLHFAVAHNNIDITKALLAAKVDVNQRDKYGNNSLWTAVFNARGKYEIVQLLRAEESDALTKNKAGRSPLDFAAQIGDKLLLSLLV